MTTAGARPRSRAAVAAGLVEAAHAGPTVTVTVVTALLGVAAGLRPGMLAVVTAAVLAGQLTIGWGNDLVDAERDAAVGRGDKPLADGRVPRGLALRCLAVAALACVVLSFAAGWRTGLVHLVLGVGMGHAYNLALKRTVWSWLPYAVAFGVLPAIVALAADPPRWPAWWLVAASAALGVGAHLLNAVRDLDEDVRTGVRGLPHRLGERRSRVSAAVLLGTASVVAALGPAGPPATWAWVALAAALALAAAAMTGRGAVPFRAAIAVALLDVVLLVAGS